ncbi:MAG: PorV/PorQ family protein [Bacillota bacterium]
MRVKIGVLLLTVVFALSPAWVAQADGDPVGTAAMMDIGMGARALGMGGAFIAVADDACAVYYNPAGLALLEGRHVASLYTNQYGAAGYMALGYAQRNVGAGVLMLDATGVEETDEFANVTGFFGIREYTATGAYGATVWPNLSLGGAVKHYSQSLPGNAGTGLTGDIGLLYVAPGVRVGAVARNVLGSVKYASGETDAFDRSWGVGLAVKPMAGLLLAADAVAKDELTLRIGAEYLLGNFAVRGGGMWGGGQTSLTAGLGVVMPGFSVDYAYQTHNVLPDCHRLSLSIRF